MLPSEREIERKIELLDPGEFQRLAEYFVMFDFPKRFRNLVPGGRNPKGETVKGWPDIYAINADGKLDLCEATKGEGWPRHLEEDISKAEKLGPDRFASFVFVAWANEPSMLGEGDRQNPKSEKLSACRERLEKLGIPSENIHFIFKKRLVLTLSQPRYGRLLHSLLGLKPNCFPFRSLRKSNLFGTSTTLSGFSPSIEEFEAGLVRRQSLIAMVEERLDRQGWAFVRGRGAAGKTTLAIHIGLAVEASNSPVYYLDAGKILDSSDRAFEVLTNHSDSGVLFILDNVHLNEEFARDIFEHWREASHESRLLLIGRKTTALQTAGRVSPLGDLVTESLQLKVEADDLIGVFRRLARRLQTSETDAKIPQPPQGKVNDWLNLFEGDLIAFSAAVSGRLRQLLASDWTLNADHTIEYVRNSYFKDTDKSERLNLLRIAALAELELLTPAGALETEKLGKFVNQGIVHHYIHGPDEKFKKYSLVHHGLGRLLLAAGCTSEIRLNEFSMENYRYVSKNDPFTGFFISQRLEANEQQEEAFDLLHYLFDSAFKQSTTLFSKGLHWLKRCTEQFLRAGFSHSQIDERLISVKTELADGSLRTPLSTLFTFLKYAEDKLPLTYTSISHFLQQTNNINQLAITSLRMPLHVLASFLKYAENKLPLTYTSLARFLQQADNINQLAINSLRTPFEHLTFFLKYAEDKLPLTYTSISHFLQQPDNINQLASASLRTPLGFLATFLKYAEDKLPLTYTSISHFLQQTDNINQLTNTAFCTSFNHLLFFLKTSPLSKSIVNRIDKPEWDNHWLKSISHRPTYFQGLANELQHLGRLELAEAPACALIATAEPTHWHASGIGLHQLGRVLTLGKSVSENDLKRFLERIVTPDWLEVQFSQKGAGVGNLAALFLGLWGNHASWVIRHFMTPILDVRIRLETRNLRYSTTAELAERLELVGCVTLVGAFPNLGGIRYPDRNQIIEALRFWPLTEKMPPLRNIQIQLWLGIHELARIHPQTLTIPAELGEPVLNCWHETPGNTPKQKTLNEWMIRWLERCSNAGWELIRNEQSLSALANLEVE